MPLGLSGAYRALWTSQALLNPMHGYSFSHRTQISKDSLDPVGGLLEKSH